MNPQYNPEKSWKENAASAFTKAQAEKLKLLPATEEFERSEVELLNKMAAQHNHVLVTDMMMKSLYLYHDRATSDQIRARRREIKNRRYAKA